MEALKSTSQEAYEHAIETGDILPAEQKVDHRRFKSEGRYCEYTLDEIKAMTTEDFNPRYGDDGSVTIRTIFWIEKFYEC